MRNPLNKHLSFFRKQIKWCPRPALIIFVLLASTGLAQLPDQVAPQQLPRTAPPTPAKPADEPPPAEGDPKVIIEKLRGLVIHGDPSQVAVEGILDPTSVDAASGVELVKLAPPALSAFQKIVRQRIGQPLSVLELNTLLRDLIVHYRDNYYPVVDAFLPEQAIENDIVQLVVIPGLLGKIKVEGSKYFKESLLVKNLRATPGLAIRSDTTAADVDFLNRNAFRRADLVYEKGEEAGTTDIILKVNERNPFRMYTSLDDTGNDLTEDLRYALGYNWANVGGWDHQASYQFKASLDMNAVRSHSLTYAIPLPWRHYLSFVGSYSDTDALFGPSDAPGVNLDSGGTSWQGSVRYTIPLPNMGGYTHETSFGYDYKYSESQLLANVLAINTNHTDVSQLAASYSASLPDSWGNTAFTLSGYYSPGSTLENNNDEEFQKSNASSAGYLYAKLEASRVTKLPADFTLICRAIYQIANENLLGSEQLGLGGYDTVRGYDEREANGDTGYFLSAEVRTPGVSIGEVLGFKTFTDSLQFLGFIDYGGVSIYTNHTYPEIYQATTNQNFTLMSVGPGVRYSINPYFSARLDYGWQMTDTGVSPITRRDDSGRAHFSITLSY
jgi:hemolysin activation/secretion protein